ncbi:MAG: hypothetical protein RMJ03_03980 [Nitrososphaerota archaeon]|nr:hypothetical protein [Candidatus Bathyarchaeota archaeon]MDW8024041.1 hypothetical protein [Nitrososphaerota archaeon]MDW8040566.1 hypothetical protein [Nitrososphaerota archaeon]
MFEELVVSAVAASGFTVYLLTFTMFAVVVLGVLLAKTDFPSGF